MRWAKKTKNINNVQYIFKLIFSLTVFSILYFFDIASSADWSRCESELGNLRREADYASDYARGAESAQNEMEDAKEELEDCLDNPEVNDLYGDNCQSYYRDYKSAKDDYESEVISLQSQISNVKSSMDSAESYCHEGGVTDWVSFCTTLLSLREKYDQATLLTTCKTQMNETLCKACLRIK